MLPKSKYISQRTYKILLGKEKLSNILCKKLCNKCKAHEAIVKALAQSK